MRLELTRRGDYAVRAALFLASTPELRTGASIAADTGIPASYVAQVMGDLVRAGLARHELGRHGGYSLDRLSADISLLAVIEAVEGDGRRQRCVLRGVRCGDDRFCQVHQAFVAAQDALFAKLASATLESLAADP